MNTSTAKPEVSVLCEGYIVREGDRVIDASSTVSSVTSLGKSILVDTGSPFKLDLLKAALDRAPMPQSGIDIVVNTHQHMDHCGGNDLFVDALRLSHRLENPPKGTLFVDEGHRLADGVMIACTPGHTSGSISVMVESDRRYAICGDAIPTRDNYDARLPPAIHVDRKLSVESMERIIEWADVIVPGHGPPFENLRKK